MKQYELTYLTAQDLSEEEVKNLQEKITAAIVATNGTVTEFQKPYKKRLAYPVMKKDIAYVNTVIFGLEPKDIESFTSGLKEESRILRSLTIVYAPFTTRTPLRRKRVIETAPAETPEKETKEVKKPAAKKEKPKAELTEIAEKLDEILQ
jgi:ribosomal protein S6